MEIPADTKVGKAKAAIIIIDRYLINLTFLPTG
jgi:hypothetical protein